MKTDRKAQSALEFMLIVAVGLMLIALSSFFGLDYIFSYSDSINGINAEQTTTDIVSAVNLVYAQGVGAQTKVAVTIPANMLLNRTYIDGNEINLEIYSGGRLKDIYKDAAVNMTGSIPIHEGPLTVYVKMYPERKAVIFIDAPVSFMLVDLFNDSGHSNKDKNFTTSDTIYYSINLADSDGNAVDSEISINVYKPDKSLFGVPLVVSTSGGSYNGSFVLTDPVDEGSWLISVVDVNNQILATSLFNKV